MLVGLFAAALPHELSQPLTGQQLKLEAVATRLEQQGTAPELVATLRSGMADGERASQMLDRIRSLIAGRPTADVARHDLVALLQDVLAIVQTRCGREGVDLQADLGPGPCWVRCDRTQLQQVLLILLANALDALATMPEGTGDRAIALSLDPGGTVARVCIRDTGRGVTPDQAEAMFQPFHTTKPDGLGVGLPLAAHLAELQGGSLAVLQPEPGSPYTGAGFALSLPGAREA